MRIRLYESIAATSRLTELTYYWILELTLQVARSSRWKRPIRRVVRHTLIRPPASEQRFTSLLEQLGGGRHDLVVGHVPYVLTNVPAMPERIVELAVQVAPKHVC